MGKLRGLPQKIGQMMGMSADAAAATPFASLGDHAQALPVEVIVELLGEAWGRPWDTVLAQIDQNGAAASLGQVHRARLRGGPDVAVKVAYPEIRDAVMSDLRLLGWLSAPLGDLRRGFDMAAYRTEIVRDLNEELDYRAELHNQECFRKIAVGLEGLIVPAPNAEWSNETVLVSAWESGGTIEEAAHWSKPDRAELARRILRHFLVTVFDHGFFHADPHPGNYRFRIHPDCGPSVVLYDYGSVASLPLHDRIALLGLITDTATRRGDPYSRLVELGFREDLLTPIERKLPAICRVLFEPFENPAKFDLVAWRRTERLDDILGEDRWNFRMAGPAKLILLMRAFRGALYYLERLGEPVSWERALAPILERSAALLAANPPRIAGRTGTGFDALARHLRIEVTRYGERRVSLIFPASSVEELSSLMDEETAAKIAERRIDLDAILRKARQTAYAPTALFTLDDPSSASSFRVWLE
jgi:predicted unusual protein kinase regulating ubiquinone biosynthesis (AarF/ABC1/UbiB family)